MDELNDCISGLANNIVPRVDCVTPETIFCSVELRALDELVLEFDMTDMTEPAALLRGWY